MSDDTMTKRGTLVRIQMVMTQLAMGHLTDGVNKVSMVKVFKPILIRVMGVGMTIEVMY